MTREVFTLLLRSLCRDFRECQTASVSPQPMGSFFTSFHRAGGDNSGTESLLSLDITVLVTSCPWCGTVPLHLPHTCWFASGAARACPGA